MIEGSTYNKLVAENGTPWSGAAAEAEDKKLQAEIPLRRSESPGARSKPIAEYEREGRQDHELMMEMIKAFRFQLAGTEMVMVTSVIGSTRSRIRHTCQRTGTRRC
jgi:hypothetical protein